MIFFIIMLWLVMNLDTTNKLTNKLCRGVLKEFRCSSPANNRTIRDYANNECLQITNYKHSNISTYNQTSTTNHPTKTSTEINYILIRLTLATITRICCFTDHITLFLFFSIENVIVYILGI